MVTNALRVYYHPAVQTALAQGVEHLTEDSDFFSHLLSHVAKHMLVFQGEGPAQPTLALACRLRLCTKLSAALASMRSVEGESSAMAAG